MLIDQISRRLREMALSAAKDEGVQKVVKTVVPSALDHTVRSATGSQVAGLGVKKAAQLAAEADPEGFARVVMQVALPIAAPFVAVGSLPILVGFLAYEGIKKLGE